jgi:hypothetical protein
MTARRAWALLFLGVAAIAPEVDAHTRATSYSEWTLTESGASVRARATQLELTRLALDPQTTPDYARRVAEVLQNGLQLWAGDRPCAPAAVHAEATADGWVRASWDVACPPELRDAVRSVRTQLLVGVAPGHLHFARVQLADAAVRERVLTAVDPVFELPAADPGSLAHYVTLGIGHILSGWDHLAFILGLLLLAGSLTEMALIATGFTLAHSLTLGAATLGLVHTSPTAVEALIGFTIALVAVESAWFRAHRPAWMPELLTLLVVVAALQLPVLVAGGLAVFTLCYFATLDAAARPERWRIAMALLFGLIHGFGFAGALVDLRLPTERLATALFGFNVGVELGQLVVIAAVWPLLRIVARWPVAVRWAHEGLAAGLCGLGVFWFVARSFG